MIREALWALPLPHLLTLLSLALAAILACGAGLLAAWFLRHRAVPVQYGLLLSALALTLTAPLLTQTARMTNMGRIEVSVAPVPPQPAAPQPAPVETRPVVQSSPVVVAPPAIATRPAVRAESLSMLWRRYFSWRVLGTVLAIVWALGIVVGLARLLIGAVLVWRLKRSSEPSVSARVLNSATNAARLLGLRDTPEIRVSSLTVSPMVMGVARPAILLPSGLEERLDDAHLAAALLHETGHIAHRDTLIGLFQRVAATLFWWCPLVHLVNRRLDDLREDICDNYVIRAQGDGLCLAQVLVHVAERTQDWARMRWIGAMAMTEPTGKGFEGRVRRLLQKERSTVTRMNLAAVCATMTFAALLGGAILATTVRAADKSEDAANAKTPELRVRPAKQQGQFDLELRMPDKRSSPRMIVEAGNWGMLEVALGEAAQLTFRARVNTEKQPVRVSCLVTVAVTGGFHQWILDDEPWPLGEWKALKETAASQPAAPGAIMHGDLVDGGRARVVIQTSRRIRPTDADDWRTAEAIAPMVAVAELQSGLESRDLLRILRATFAREGPPAEMANPWILALGPVLDSSDTVAVTSMEQEGDVLQVSVDYTSARVRGVNLRANDAYRPLCIVPIPQSMPAGKYRLVTTWRCVDQPAKGGKLPAPLVMKTEFVYAYAQEPPPADSWGRAVNSLQTRLTAEKDRVKAGEPIRLKLELRNVGTENRSHDAQQVAVNDPLIARGPKGEEIPFVAGRVSTLGGGHSIKPGETVVLFDGLDAAGQYLLTAPGVHTLQFRGRETIAFLGEGETSIPPSNTIRVELTGEPPATVQAARAFAGAGAIRVRILSGSDRDPARDAVEEWIAKGLADAGSPVTSALTDWITLSDNEQDLYSSMQGGRIIKGRVNDKGEVEITGMKIGPSPRIIAVRSGQKQVVKLTNYPGAGNVFLAVEAGAGAAPATRPAADGRAARLLGDLKTFTLELNYSGQQEKPYHHHLLLSVPPLPGKDRDNAFFRQARVTEQQAKAIIEYLLKNGYFDVALDGDRDAGPLPPKESYYSLDLRVENDGNPVQFEEWLPLAKLLLYQRLNGLRRLLDGDAAKEMDELNGGLASDWYRVSKVAARQEGMDLLIESTPGEEIAWGKETNGVVANLRALKTDVQSGEPITFEIQIKNVSQKDVYLLSGEGGKKMDATCWLFRFDQWEWSTPIPSMFRAPLKPGETARVRCVVQTTRDFFSLDPHFDAPFRNVKNNAESVRLPAGNYRVYAKWRFNPPGPVETNPIEVRITDHRESKQPALVITDADNGKTVQATVGQEVRVSLKGERKQTGWEVSQGEGEALRPLKPGGTIGDTPIPALEFTPDKEGVDDIGTYTFHYTAAVKGTSTLRFVYVYPGGSKPTPRTKTALVREFRVTVEVGAPAMAPSTSADVKAAEAEVADAARNLARVTELVRQGLAPMADQEKAQVDLARAKLRLELAKADTDAARHTVTVKLAEVDVAEAERRLARVSELFRQALVPAAEKEQAERELARAKGALAATAAVRPDAAKPAARAEDALDQQIRSGRVVEGKPLALGGGLALSCFCQAQAAPPTPEKATPLIVGVRVTNTGTKDIEFQPAEFQLMLKWGDGPMQTLYEYGDGAVPRLPPVVLKPGEKWTWTVADAQLNYGGRPVYLSFMGHGHQPGQFLERELKGKADRIAFAAQYQAGKAMSEPCEPVVCRLTETEVGSVPSKIGQNKGLSVTVTPVKATFAEKEGVHLRISLRNEQSNPITIHDPRIADQWKVKCTSATGKSYVAGHGNEARMTPGELVLKQGQAETLEKVITAWREEAATEQGHRPAFALPPGKYVLEVTFTPSPPKHETIVYWDKTATSNRAEFEILGGPGALQTGRLTETEETKKDAAPTQPTAPAAGRAAKLLGDLKTFTLQLNYSGQQEKPYYHLLLSVPPLPGNDRDNPFFRQARVTEQQARTIIEHLLKNGYFDVALDGNRNCGPVPPKEPYYSLALRVENDGNPVQFEQWLPLAKPVLFERLDGLRGVLEGDAAKDMDLLIGRLAGERKDATTQPVAGGKITEDGAKELAKRHLAEKGLDWGEPVKVVPVVSDFKLYYATPQSELDRGIGQRVVLVTGTGEVRILPRR